MPCFARLATCGARAYSLIALFAGALCYPKVTGQKWGDAKRVCPEGYELGKDVFGKAV
jgi:hypothetical protein